MRFLSVCTLSHEPHELSDNREIIISRNLSIIYTIYVFVIGDQRETFQQHSSKNTCARKQNINYSRLDCHDDGGTT